MTIQREGHIATLWRMTCNEARVSCVVYQSVEGMQLRLESATAIIFSEPFDMEPRNVARTKTLRESLKRRGWTEM